MKKALVYGGITLVVVIIIVVLIKIFNPFGYRFNEMTLDEYVNYNRDNGPVLLYVYDESKEGAKEYSDIIRTALENKETPTYALNYEKITSDAEKEKFKNANVLTITLKDDVLNNSIPMLILVENGKIKTSIGGIYTQKEFDKFVKENKIK